jgi:hypothetical protein
MSSISYSAISLFSQRRITRSTPVLNRAEPGCSGLVGVDVIGGSADEPDQRDFFATTGIGDGAGEGRGLKIEAYSNGHEST